MVGLPTGGARIVLADPHPLVREALRLACGSSPELEVVDEAGTAEDLLAASRRSRPDVLVMELDLPDRDGLDVIQDLRAERFGGAVVVLTDRTDGAAVLAALRLGVEGYLVKAKALPAIAAELRRVLAGERVISPELEEVAVTELGRFARQAREGTEVRSTLTAREHEILEMISRGLTMQQIATRLGISPRTVETHVAKLYRKLAVRSRVQAVARAASLGLIELR